LGFLPLKYPELVNMKSFRMCFGSHISPENSNTTLLLFLGVMSGTIGMVATEAHASKVKGKVPAC
jgi:hypothetical protein